MDPFTPIPLNRANAQPLYWQPNPAHAKGGLRPPFHKLSNTLSTVETIHHKAKATTSPEDRQTLRILGGVASIAVLAPMAIVNGVFSGLVAKLMKGTFKNGFAYGSLGTLVTGVVIAGVLGVNSLIHRNRPPKA